MPCFFPLLLSVCLLFVQPAISHNGGATPVTPRHGLVDYIRAGLGDSIVTTRTTITSLLVETSTAGDPPRTSTSQHADDLSGLATCAARWSSYSIQASGNVDNVAITYLAVTLVNTTIVYGTGDVYTSYGTIPVASGEFTPTRTAARMFNVSTTTSSFKSTTYNEALLTQTPACSFSPRDCSRLYVSYISSLGLPYNASVPKITPAPENSPHCPDYYYKPYSTSYGSTQQGLSEDCKLYGNSVELFYFPSRTAGDPEPTTPVTYEYKPGTTFTSPSIYLSFDYISATRYIPLSVASYFVSCGLAGCVTQAVGGGDAVDHEGTVISGQILTMAPTDVSSIVLKYDATEETRVISTLRNNRRGYADLAMQIKVGAVISKSLTAERLRIEDLVHPPPRAYYLRPEGAPGCNFPIYSPQCATIFEGAYRAIISLPSEVSGLQGAWKTCNPAIYGVYDPPLALTEAASVARPTLPAGYSPPPAPTTARPYTITPPLAIPKTALRVTLPSATKDEVMHPEPTLLVPSPAPSHGQSGNGEQPNTSRNGGSQGQGRPEPSAQNDNGAGRGGDSSDDNGSNGGDASTQAGRTSSHDDSAGMGNPASDREGSATSTPGREGSATSTPDREGSDTSAFDREGSAISTPGREGSATFVPDRGSRSHATSDETASSRQSGSRDPTAVSSSILPSDSLQLGWSGRLSTTPVHWVTSFGAVILAFAT